MLKRTVPSPASCCGPATSRDPSRRASFSPRFQPEQSEIELFDRGIAYVLADRTPDAVRLFELAVERTQGVRPAVAMLAAAYAQAGRKDDAERQAAVVRQGGWFPDFSRDEFGSLLRSTDLREKIAFAFKKAGL